MNDRMNPFGHEVDVRSWMRTASDGKARWTEPARGSTPGLPDCWLPFRVNGFERVQTLHLELKAGAIEGGLLKYTVRPEQRREIPAMVRDGIAVGLLIGIKGTTDLVFALPNPYPLRGEIDPNWWQRRDAGCMLVSGEENASALWRGVNFIWNAR